MERRTGLVFFLLWPRSSTADAGEVKNREAPAPPR